MTACGVWPAARGLVAAILDDAGHLRSCRVADTDDARTGLVLWLTAAGAALVVDAALAQADPLPGIALRAGLTVWVADSALVTALRHAAGLGDRGARPSAAMLARLLGSPLLRAQLRPLCAPTPDPRQIALL